MAKKAIVVDTAELMRKAGFEPLTSTKVFTNRPTVTTPIKALNAILGGGLPLGIVVEYVGPPASGKSSFGYEVMANFQKEYPNGLAVLIESEASADIDRTTVLGLDPSRMHTIKGKTLDETFLYMENLLSGLSEIKEKDRPEVMILWDSIANAPTSAQVEKKDINGGGMAEAPRIIKQSLKRIVPYLETLDVAICILNQVMTNIGSYVGGFTEGGGMGLKHGVHLKLEFSGVKTEYENFIAHTATGRLSITKSKLTPLVKDMPIVFDIMRGGAIDQSKSYMTQLSNYSIDTNGSFKAIKESVKETYAEFMPYIEVKYPKLFNNFYWKYLLEVVAEDDILLDIFSLPYLDFLMTYSLQKQTLIKHRKKVIDGIKKGMKGLDTTEVIDG